ncbi:MAG: T9SS type A sorting domain-containing protein, partial [Bacteroidetes bacterium]|nr:T9SS type A sorting domain-containing protein [Bacteroidota bacterium]
YQNTGNPVSASWVTNNAVFAAIGNQTYWNSPDLADLNGDEKPDLVFGSAAGPLNYYVNTGSPSVPAWQVNTTLFGGVLDVGGASNPYFFDFDYDGDLDLFSGSQLGNIKYYENTGTASGPAWTENSGYFTTLKHSIYGAVAIGDVNADSLPDAIVGDLSGKLYYHRNTGVGFVLEAGALGTVALGGWSSPRLVDLDQDGDLDIVAGNEAGKLNYIRNTGSSTNPVWTVIPNFFGTIDVGSNCVPAIADLDMDGDLDIITGNISGDVRYFENTGTSWVENPTPVQGISGGQNTAPAFADLDADGDYDLTLGNYDGTFDYFKNNAIITGSGKTPVKLPAISLSASPNPFSESTVLHFEMGSKADVSLQVFNIGGKVIFSENWKNMAPGNHCQTWNAGELMPGVYFFRLITGENAETIKVIKQ